ncbi:MAG: head GIN domain-containing protein [Bacteroidota bacterium]
MKTVLNLTLAATLALTGIAETNAQWRKVTGNGNVTTKTINTGDYDAVKVVGSMDVHLEKGSEGNITVKTDDNLHEYLDIEVKGDALVIKSEKNISLRTKKGIHVYVPFEKISKVALTGSGDIDTKDTIDAPEMSVSVTGSGDVVLDINAGMVDADITGSGDMVLRGKTQDLEVQVTGSGDFKGFELEAQNTNARVSGSGDAKVVAKNSLKARVNGSGDIDYKGNPEKRDTKTSGSGDISSY